MRSVRDVADDSRRQVLEDLYQVCSLERERRPGCGRQCPRRGCLSSHGGEEAGGGRERAERGWKGRGESAWRVLVWYLRLIKMRACPGVGFVRVLVKVVVVRVIRREGDA